MKPIAVALMALTMVTAGHAQVSVKDAWVRATVPQQKATGAFMQIVSAKDARLVGALSPVAGVVEIHEMSMVNQVMHMRAVFGLELPAGKTVELRPGGYHVMLMDLKAQVKPDDLVPLMLVIEGRDGKRQNLDLQVPARALGGVSSPASKNQGHQSNMKH